MTDADMWLDGNRVELVLRIAEPIRPADPGELYRAPLSMAYVQARYNNGDLIEFYFDRAIAVEDEDAEPEPPARQLAALRIESRGEPPSYADTIEAIGRAIRRAAHTAIDPRQ